MIAQFAPGAWLLLALSASVQPALGQDWTRFRGPNGSGETETAGIPITWTDQDYRWRTELPGSGHSSPVVWGDRVYVTAGLDEDATRIVCCLRTTDGGIVWKKTFPSKTHKKNNANNYAASTPAVDAHRLYVTWATPEEYKLLALDRSDGRELWRCDFGPFLAEHGFGASPILAADLVIVPNDQNGSSSVIAVEQATGKTRWTASRRTEKAAYSTPVLYQPDGKGGTPQLILTSWAHGINSLDPATGKLNWELPVLKFRCVGSPMVAAGLIFAACGEGGGGRQMFAVRPGDPEKKTEAKVEYPVEGKLPYVVTPVARGNLLFLWADSGIVACLEAPTGKTLWRERVGGNFFCSPVRVADRLYCVSREGEVVVLAAADQYKLLGKTKLGESSQATPAVADGVMYLRTRSHVMAIGEKKPL